MQVKKGTIVEVRHSRTGKWTAIATKDFDTETQDFYPFALHQDVPVFGLNTRWLKGEDMPAKKQLCTFKIIK